MAEQKQYVLGRGELHFARFLPGTQTPDSFIYIGNTPEVSLNIEVEDLQHFDADQGIREEDDNVVLEVMRTGSFVTDNINAENVALFFMGDADILTQAAIPPVSQLIEEARRGRGYALGSSDTNPEGFMGIDPATFSVMLASGSVAATGTVTIGAGNASAGDTVVIGSRTYTYVASSPAANQVLVGSNPTQSAANLVAAIMGGPGSGSLYGAGTLPHAQVSATSTGGTVTITSRLFGSGGNSITLSATGVNITVSGANLSGGANGTLLVADVDYRINLDTGFLTFPNTSPALSSPADVYVQYGVRASTRTVVLSGNVQVEGAFRFESKNARGPDQVIYMPWVKVSPNGDYALKGDEWQQIPMQFKVMKKPGEPAIRRNGLPAYL
jgi:hypothetical protein